MTETTTVEVVRTEDLGPAVRASIIGVCIAAHDNEDFHRMFSYYIPSGGRHFLGYKGAELVSHAVITTRWLELEGHGVLRTAYVDAVSTHPAYQGRGHASAVMRALAANVDDYDIGCLETGRQTFYETLGWERWRGALAGRTKEAVIPTPDQEGVMILRLARTPATLDVNHALTVQCEADGRIW